MGAQPNDFRYFLTVDDVRTELIFAPNGWDKDTVATYKRNESYFGVFRSYALPLEFVMDGADILRGAMYKYGIEAEVIFEIEELRKATWMYDPLFKGDIDFSTFDDGIDSFAVTIMEGGLTKALKAYEGVKYEYDLSGSDVVNVKLPGVAFSEYTIFTNAFDSVGLQNTFVKGLSIATSEVGSGYVAFQNTQTELNPNLSTSVNWFGQSTKNLTLNISGYINAGILLGGNTSYEIKIINNSGQQKALIFKTIQTGSYQVSLQVNVSFPVSPNEKLFFYFQKIGSGFASCNPDDVELRAFFTTTSDASNCKGISAFNLFKRIIGRISPGTEVNSFMLQNSWPNLIFTSGDGIRELTGAKIKITFKDFFATFVGLMDAAFGIENGIAVLEDGPYFARNIQTLYLSEVKDCKIQLATSVMFNSVKIGYDDGNTENTDGKEEYNSSQIWQLPITRIQKQQDWISPTRADQYGIERLRVDFIRKTNDTSSDNDTFMLDCSYDGINYNPVTGATYTKVEGLSSGASAYNLELTPKKNLLRHEGYLRSILDRLDTRYINFASGNKNTSVLTIKNGIRVKEDENIPVSSLSGKYFLPYLASFTTKLPYNATWLIENTPFGYISFVWKDVLLKGYIMEVSVDKSENTEREFKLLLTNDNNLQNLV